MFRSVCVTLISCFSCGRRGSGRPVSARARSRCWGDPQSGATVTSSPAQPTDEIDPLKRQPNEKQKKAAESFSQSRTHEGL